MPQTSLDGRCCAAEAINAAAPNMRNVNHGLEIEIEEYLVGSKS
jgi:hypothetical protein